MAQVYLIIPAFNEEPNIRPLLSSLPEGLFERVILVDNGSTDGTARVARECGAQVVTEPRRGYGNACLAGLEWARQNGPPDVVVFLDADRSDDPGQLRAVVEPVVAGRVEMVIGSRPRRAAAGALTPVQRFGNWLSCMLIRWTTGAKFTDLGPMRAVRWSTLEALGMKDKTWGWTVEMQFKIGRMGAPFCEIDVPYERRKAGVSKISGSVIGSVKAGWKILTTILLLWLAWRPERPRN